MIRVLLADDQALVRGGFQLILNGADDIDVVAEAADGDDAIAQCRQHRPDVALLDIRMPGVDGLDAATTAINRLRNFKDRIDEGLFPDGADADLQSATATAKARFEAALLTLVVNARDAMPDGGTIVIGTGDIELGPGAVGSLAAGSFIKVSVTDSGSGMSSKVASRAFEPFFTTKPEGQGTGQRGGEVPQRLGQRRAAARVGVARRCVNPFAGGGDVPGQSRDRDHVAGDEPGNWTNRHYCDLSPKRIRSVKTTTVRRSDRRTPELSAGWARPLDNEPRRLPIHPTKDDLAVTHARHRPPTRR